MQKSSLNNLTKEEKKELYNRLKSIRKEFKPVNYSAIYGIGPPKLAMDMDIPKGKAVQLLNSYWERNWAVKSLVKNLETKEAGGFTWLKNPVSGFWNELRYDKDRFSTLNQSTGVYCFDSWLARCYHLGYIGFIQFHDETGAITENESQTRDIMLQAIEMTNKDLNLNVTLGIDFKFGRNYADVH